MLLEANFALGIDFEMKECSLSTIAHPSAMIDCLIVSYLRDE